MRSAMFAAAVLLACHSQPASRADDPKPSEAAKPSEAKPEAALAAAKPDAVAKAEDKKPEKSEGEGYADSTRSALIGHRAPEATLPLLDGGKLALGELLGKKPVYLKFWATWCKPCRAQMPHLAAAYRKYNDRVAVYAIDLGVNDPIETVRAFQAEQKLPMPIAIDAEGTLAERFHVAVTPLHIVIDRSGVVRYVGHEANAALDGALEQVASDTGAGPSLAAAAPVADPPRSEPGPLALSNGTAFAVATGKPVALAFLGADPDAGRGRPFPDTHAGRVLQGQTGEDRRRRGDADGRPAFVHADSYPGGGRALADARSRGCPREAGEGRRRGGGYAHSVAGGQDTGHASSPIGKSRGRHAHQLAPVAQPHDHFPDWSLLESLPLEDQYRDHRFLDRRTAGRK